MEYKFFSEPNPIYLAVRTIKYTLYSIQYTLYIH